MGDKTTISWCHHTLNCWIGCHKVSPACKHCYAEAFAKRTGKDVWGADKPRYFVGEDTWKKPLKWNRDAERAGERRRVFCGSMMDVFELHPSPTESGMQLVARSRLWQLIDATPWLDWLLLTKRPENAEAVLPLEWWRNGLPRNVWMGTTVENQEYVDLRIPHLLKIPARVRFLSCEPMLGPVALGAALGRCNCMVEAMEGAGMHAATCPATRPRIDWVIAGGESGAHHREHRLEWSRSLRNQCAAAGTAFFFKQLGELVTEEALFSGLTIPSVFDLHENIRVRLALAPRSKGESLDEIPPDLRIRQFPRTASEEAKRDG